MKQEVKKKQWVKNGVTKRVMNGYVQVKIGRAWIGEHRLVVEDKIGRVLNCNEVIHHIDGNRANNLIENLMLFKTQKAHQKWHLKEKQFGMTNPMKKQIKERWKEFK